jgi:RNA polymerase sigma-70 factor (ECF subfamily)
MSAETEVVTGPARIEQELRSDLLSALAGDGPAYHRFLKALQAHLRAFLRKRLRQAPDEVEDLLQEVLIAVHNQRHTYDARQPLTAWIHAIAKYKLVDLMRRRGRREDMTDTLDSSDDVCAHGGGEAAHACRDLHKLLATLPPRQREPITLTKLHGLSVVETARLTGMSESAVKTSVHRGLKALAARLRGARAH